MGTFRDFVEQAAYEEPKLWKAKRQEILTFWQNLVPDLPIQAKPVEEGHKGTRFRKDGVRITGSSEFINSILSHLKDILRYESDPRSKLDVEYRQIMNKDHELQNLPVYACYVHVVADQDKLTKVLEPEFKKPEEIKPFEPPEVKI